MQWVESGIKEIVVGEKGIMYIIEINGKTHVELRAFLTDSESYMKMVKASA